MKLVGIKKTMTALLVMWSGLSANGQQDTIYIASEPDYPPYCIVNEQGLPDGLAVELFRAAAQAVGLHAEIKIGVWDAIKKDLEEGRIDALPLVGRTPEREALMDFTMPYLSLHGAVFTRTDRRDIQSLDDLKNKEIVVMKGDNAEEFVRRVNLTSQVITTSTFEEAFRRLAEGEYDASLTQRITGLNLIEQLKIKNLEAKDFQIPEFRQDFCFAVQEGNTDLLNRLNEGLSIIIANDTFNDIRKKWMGSLVEQGFTIREIMKTVIPVSAGVLLFTFLIFIAMLRLEVKRKTQILKTEILEHRQTLNQLHEEQKNTRASEERIRLLLDSTAEGIYGIDRNGCCTLVNQSALKALGYENSQEVMGQNMHQLIHHSYPDGSAFTMEHCKINQAMKTGQGTHADDEYLWRADGSGFPAEYYSFPIIENGEVTGSVVTFWDISDRKKNQEELLRLKNDLQKQVQEQTAELVEKVAKLDKSQTAMLYMVEDLNLITAQLKKEQKNLEIANQELEAFTYSVSHDLRAPLRAINGFANFLKEDYGHQLDQEGLRYIQTIRDNADKMDQLILDLLNLSRVSRYQITLHKIDMRKMALEAFNETASEKELHAFDVVLGDLHEGYGDQGLIKQVWINLISNAIKYSSKSEVKKIEIESHEEDDQIRYSIRDHGAGFNEAYAGKLFGIFQRLHRESEFEGIGIGLALVKRIITRHHGTVGANGKENLGATFFFTLPKSYI